MQIQELNERFAIPDRLAFSPDKSGFVHLNIHNTRATAIVSLYGAQVLSYQPANTSDDLLFLSERAYYKEGKAIKGGIPVCWPWFGPDPEHRGRPAHGFARTSQWDVLETAAEKSGSIRLGLGLKLNDTSRALWVGEVEARLDIVIGENLQLTLTTFNTGNEPMQLTQALHTYFNVGDSSRASVTGLENKTYIDKADQDKEKIQQGPVTISSEVDRIYTDICNDLVIHDPVLDREICIESTGSASTVVWNPWKAIAADMDDLGDNDYRRMLCVETAKAGRDIATIVPGDHCKLSAKYRIG